MRRAANHYFLSLMQGAGALVLLIVIDFEVCEHRLYVAVHVAVFNSDIREGGKLAGCHDRGAAMVWGQVGPDARLARMGPAFTQFTEFP